MFATSNPDEMSGLGEDSGAEDEISTFSCQKIFASHSRIETVETCVKGRGTIPTASTFFAHAM